jgi:oligopeptide/dipeptide ABC transporter ATP-binding protein
VNTNAPLLDVRDLRTYFFTNSGVARAVDGVSFSLARGQVLGLVGESGSGKSVTCMSIVRLVAKPAGRIVGGEVLLEGRDLLSLPESEMRKVRGDQVSVITQDPMSSLNPVYTIENQMAEPLRYHQGVRDHATLQTRILSLLKAVGIPSAERRMRDYPHQLSGGQRQRIVTAMALECQPSLLIADEPTTALDVTVQNQVLRLLREVQREFNLGMIMVTHDLSVVARICETVAVMYAGRIVEMAPLVAIFEQPQHPYTRALMRALPRPGQRAERLDTIEGQPPDTRRLEPGCPFAARCPDVMERCRVEYPPERIVADGHRVNCWAVTAPVAQPPEAGVPA